MAGEVPKPRLTDAPRTTAETDSQMEGGMETGRSQVQAEATEKLHFARHKGHKVPYGL